MVKQLRSDIPTPPSIQFAHFGVLDDGKQSKGAFTTAVITNLIIAALILIVGSAVKSVVNSNKQKEIAYVEPVKEPPPIVKPPPPILKVPPPPPKVLEPPKIKLEPEKLPEVKPVEVKMTPQPLHMQPAPPKAVTPPPAPKIVSLAVAQPAAVANNDAHPSAVRLGNPDNPLKPLTGPAISKVNFGVAGHPGMPASNTGSGPHSATSVSGFGCPTCTDMSGKDRGTAKVVGVQLTAGGNGPVTSKNLTGAPVNVHLQTAAPPPSAATPILRTATAAAPPKVTYKPQPVYTEEAKQMHLEGAVSIRIRVMSSGAVQVVEVTHGLGHGLDESAKRAIQGTRFSPALDATGHPVDWEGVVNVNFQMAG
jgi:protein TonB